MRFANFVALLSLIRQIASANLRVEAIAFLAFALCLTGLLIYAYKRRARQKRCDAMLARVLGVRCAA